MEEQPAYLGMGSLSSPDSKSPATGINKTQVDPRSQKPRLHPEDARRDVTANSTRADRPDLRTSKKKRRFLSRKEGIPWRELSRERERSAHVVRTSRLLLGLLCSGCPQRPTVQLCHLIRWRRVLLCTSSMRLLPPEDLVCILIARTLFSPPLLSSALTLLHRASPCHVRRSRAPLFRSPSFIVAFAALIGLRAKEGFTS